MHICNLWDWFFKTVDHQNLWSEKAGHFRFEATFCKKILDKGREQLQIFGTSKCAVIFQ